MWQVTQKLLNLVVTAYLLFFGIYLVLRYWFGDDIWWLSLLNTFAYGWFLPLLVFMPVALFLRHRQSITKLVPIAAIAGLWFVPYYLPKHIDTAVGPQLHVVAANVWGRNHHLGSIEGWLRQTSADILILQEISPTYATQALPGLLDVYPYQMNQTDDTRWGGNLTLSRYPILDWEYVDLQVPDQAFPLRIVIDFHSQPIAIYNVHLAWPGHRRPRVPLPEQWNTLYTQVIFGFDDRVRNQQITSLLNHLQNEPYPYIVGGDFNMSDQSMTYQQVAATMNDSFREAGYGFLRTWPVSVARDLPSILPPLVRIDYIWHSDEFRTIDAKMSEPIGSDHLPVQALLTFTSAS